MTDATPPLSSPRPLYSPRSPVLRGFLVLLVAGFVVLHECFSSLFNFRPRAAALAPDDPKPGLSHNAVR